MADMQAIIEADLHRELGAGGSLGIVEPATYWPVGTAITNPGFAVKVHVGSSSLQRRPAGARITAGASGNGQPDQGFFLLVVAARADETVESGSPVGVDGGVVLLQTGDILLVPGRCVGVSAATKHVRVTGDVRRDVGHWTAMIK